MPMRPRRHDDAAILPEGPVAVNVKVGAAGFGIRMPGFAAGCGIRGSRNPTQRASAPDTDGEYRNPKSEYRPNYFNGISIDRDAVV